MLLGRHARVYLVAAHSSSGGGADDCLAASEKAWDDGWTNCTLSSRNRGAQSVIGHFTVKYSCCSGLRAMEEDTCGLLLTE